MDSTIMPPHDPVLSPLHHRSKTDTIHQSPVEVDSLDVNPHPTSFSAQHKLGEVEASKSDVPSTVNEESDLTAPVPPPAPSQSDQPKDCGRREDIPAELTNEVNQEELEEDKLIGPAEDEQFEKEEIGLQQNQGEEVAKDVRKSAKSQDVEEDDNDLNDIMEDEAENGNEEAENGNEEAENGNEEAENEEAENEEAENENEEAENDNEEAENDNEEAERRSSDKLKSEVVQDSAASVEGNRNEANKTVGRPEEKKTSEEPIKQTKLATKVNKVMDSIEKKVDRTVSKVTNSRSPKTKKNDYRRMRPKSFAEKLTKRVSAKDLVDAAFREIGKKYNEPDDIYGSSSSTSSSSPSSSSPVSSPRKASHQPSSVTKEAEEVAQKLRQEETKDVPVSDNTRKFIIGGLLGHLIRRFGHVSYYMALPYLYYWHAQDVANYYTITREQLLAIIAGIFIIGEAIRIALGATWIGMRKYEANQICGVVWGTISALMVFFVAPKRGISIFDQAYLGAPIVWSNALIDPLLGEMKHRKISFRNRVIVGMVGVALIWICSMAWMARESVFGWMLIPIMSALIVACEYPSLKYIDDNGMMILVPLALEIILFPWHD